MGDRAAQTTIATFATRHGTVAAFATDLPIAKSLARYGEWAEAELQTLLALIRPGDVVLDVGAHVGIFTLAFARRVASHGRVLAFEPQPALFDLLKRNLADNHVAGIVDPRNSAVGRSSGYVRLPPVDYSQPGNFGAIAPQAGLGGPPEDGGVALQKIDDLRLSNCRLIKADVEGAELQVIEGAQETIRRLRPIVSVEANTIEAALRRMQALRELSLETWLLAAPAFNPLNWRRDPKDFFDLAHECAIVGAAREDAHDVGRAARLGAVMTPVSNIDQLARAFVEVPLPNDPEFERASVRQNLRRLHRERSQLLQSNALREELLQDLAASARKLARGPIRNLRNYILFSAARLANRGSASWPSAWRKKLSRILRKKNPDRFSPVIATRGIEPKQGPQQTAEHPSAPRAEAAPPPSTQQPLQRMIGDLAAAGIFDRAWYLGQNPEVQLTGLDPLEHYLSTGWRERRDPTNWFSTSYYLSANPDVAAAGVNPFWHYAMAGQREGRRIAPLGGAAAEVLLRLVPLSEQRMRARQARAAETAPQRLGEEAIERLVKAGAAANRLMIALSQDDYRRTSAGVQLCLRIEQQAATAELGSAYLNLHPWIPLPTLVAAGEAETYDLVMVLNGQALGMASAGTILAALGKLASGVEVSLVVHSLVGHATEFVAQLYKATRARAAIFWVHDFFAACTSYMLMRNGITYCSAPPVDSAACRICFHGSERGEHQKRMQALFAGVRFQFITPSEVARRVWSAATGHRESDVKVIPHCTFGESRPPRAEPRQTDAGPARIAFLGGTRFHKGWNVFAELAKAFRGDARYQFLQLGAQNQFLPDVAFERVSAADEGRDAMIHAVIRNEVDVVLTWTLKPEVFGFVGHEAIAGGAVIVAWEGSGHLADLARSSGRGVTFPDIGAMQSAFRDGTIHDLAALRRAAGRITYDLVFSRMSIELLAQPAHPEAVT